MNKRGQTLGISIMTAIFVLVVGLMFLNFLTPEITTFRTDLNCATPSDITDGEKLICLVSGITIPYWILLVFSVVIGIITSRLLLK